MKPILYMTAGIPGSGKSTWAAEKTIEGFNHHSSDGIRNELGIFPDGRQNTNIFELLGKRVQEDLMNGKSCIYDATNLIRKYRLLFLESLKNINCEKRCILFLCPVNICKERNSKRTGIAIVPDQAYDKMLRSFEMPDIYEGFDKVELNIFNEPHKSDMQAITYPVKDENGNITASTLSFSGIDPHDYSALSQDNPYHSCTLGEHMLSAGRYMEEKLNALFPADADRTQQNEDTLCLTERMACLKEAAYVHDLGKLFTKGFQDMRGIPTDSAHYYGHENYGAYIYLCEKLCRNDMPEIITINDERIRRIIYTAQLINWHMRPLNLWGSSPKTFQKEKEILDRYYPFLYDDIMLLHECDMAAHK